MQKYTSSVRKIWRALLVAMAMLLGAAVSRASDPGDAPIQQTRSPEQLVKEALLHEVLGDNARRAALLKQAVAGEEGFAPAQWAQGKVVRNREWMELDDALTDLSNDRRLVEYRFRRDKADDSEASQVALAQWCERRNLDSQARAHWSRVLDLNPDHLVARQTLGFQRIAGRWVSPQELDDAANKLVADVENLKLWRKEITRLRGRLLSASPTVRAQAQAALGQIQDPTASVAIELLLCSHSEPLAQMAIEVLANIPGSSTSEALARQAILSNWPATRQAAARQLQDRDRIEYVPSLLAELQLPARTATQAVRTRNGGLLHREMLLSEDRENRQVTVLDSRYRRVGLPGNGQDETMGRMLADVRNTSGTNRIGAANENLIRARDNQIICDALRASTGETFENDPQTWWDWWDQELGISREAKGLQVDYQTRDIGVLRAPTSGNPDSTGDVSQSTPAPRSHECLAAGTLVWTDRGSLGIEQVQVGDLVLGQDIATGEVDFKPVLVTTTRPPSELVEIHLQDEVLCASQGHPFWVAGEGWLMAQELEAGMVLHGQQGAVTVLAVERGQTAPTYNLVVEGFANYFAGESRVLGHDFTTRSASDFLVPGLAK